MSIEFREWPKIHRLNREVIVTEKIDGTNACIIVSEDVPHGYGDHEVVDEGIVINLDRSGETWNPAYVAAQSRKRVISPENDNFGFARWVRENAEYLAKLLGFGYHYGEWYGSGIQRGYGLQNGEKRFMLFNVDRWANLPLVVPGLEVATVLWRGNFDTEAIANVVENLSFYGSFHVKDFENPEGVVVYHVAANTAFKVTCEKDEQHKGENRGYRKDF